MKFIIRNQADIANKYIRFAKWKIRSLNRKFGKIMYSEIYVKKVATSPVVYNATVVMGVPGPDIVVSAKSQNLKELWADLSLKMKIQLRRNASKRKQL